MELMGIGKIPRHIYGDRENMGRENQMFGG
jgi:hypothetical protein